MDGTGDAESAVEAAGAVGLPPAGGAATAG
jgi:hypothetical protein